MVTFTASVVIPARDAGEHLPAALAAVRAQTHGPHEVIVEYDHEGRGPGATRNAGAARATGEVLAFTDADCRPEPGWLAAGLAAIATGADLVQGAVRPDGDAGPWDHTIRVAAPHGLFETANLLIRRELFERLGGFEPWLLPRGGKELGEDVWLGWRARRAGARIAFAGDAVVRHAVIPRSARAFVAERARLRFFPAMTARIPELREAFLHHRYFLSERSLAFDAAVAGLVAGSRRRPLLALALAGPYARALWGDARAEGPRSAGVLAAADAVGGASLVAGSVRARTIVL